MAVKHPAPFNENVLIEIGKFIERGWRVLDPMAGIGRIHLLEHCETVGVEIEPEWANQHPGTIVGDALHLPEDWAESFDAVATSVTYGNRMADHHNAKDASRRITYRHYLGRPLHPANSGQLHWGEKYREFEIALMTEVRRVLKPGGRFLLNLKNFIRNGEEIDIIEWHHTWLRRHGFLTEEVREIDTPGMRFGANREKRKDFEVLLVMRKKGVRRVERRGH